MDAQKPVLESIDLIAFEAGLAGKTYAKLIEHHVRRFNSEYLRGATHGTVALLPQNAWPVVENLVDDANETALSTPDYFQKDCARVFREIIEYAREELAAYGAPADDESLFNVFQVITLNFAYMASTQTELRKLMGIRKGLFSR